MVSTVTPSASEARAGLEASAASAAVTLLAATSLCATMVALTCTEAGVRSSEIALEETPEAEARPCLKLSWSKSSREPATVYSCRMSTDSAGDGDGCGGGSGGRGEGDVELRGGGDGGRGGAGPVIAASFGAMDVRSPLRVTVAIAIQEPE